MMNINQMGAKVGFIPIREGKDRSQATPLKADDAHARTRLPKHIYL